MNFGKNSLYSWSLQLDKVAVIKQIAEKNVAVKEKEVAAHVSKLQTSQKVLSIFVTAANRAQEEVSGAIENVVTSALQAVFGADYAFRINFVQRRSSTEADMVLVKGENEVDPLDNSGLGAANVVAVALRAAFIALDGTVSRFMSLDEPTAALMLKKQALAGGVLRSLCDKLEFQILLTTHSIELAECADSVYYVEQGNGGRAKVRRIEIDSIREILE
jgi:DNA repair exonuclease SbcCD ATPase subunit